MGFESVGALVWYAEPAPGIFPLVAVTEACPAPTPAKKHSLGQLTESERSAVEN